jgi:hypothetical protein
VRSRKDLCSKCGVPKTPENTTLNKQRVYLSYCKLCASEIAFRRLVKHMSDEERERKILKYERILKILKGEI